MTGRDPDERHRASTPLELLFDLTFVVAVAQAGTQLHHALAAGHAVHAVAGYVLVFFGIWWAWVNFTWYVTSHRKQSSAGTGALRATSASWVTTIGDRGLAVREATKRTLGGIRPASPVLDEPTTPAFREDNRDRDPAPCFPEG